MKKVAIPFIIIISSMLLLFRFGRYQIISGSLQTESVIVIICLVFFMLGVFIHKKYFKKNDADDPIEIDAQKIKELDLRERELEILHLIAKGFSNQEIGEQLFLSESTIKTHVSNILLKLDARRRTEAVRIARELQLI